MQKLLVSLIYMCILNINCKQRLLISTKCSVRTPPVSPNRALTVVSKQRLNNALTAFQFGVKLAVRNRCNRRPC